MLELQRILIIRAVMAIGLMVMMAGCGGGGSGGGEGSGSTSAISDPAGTDTGTGLTGTVTLIWKAPTTNADGTTLTDLAGYRVYYGRESGNYTEVKDVGNVTTVSIDELPNIQSGIWYFAVTAYDTSGNESDYSNEVSKTIL